MSGNSIQVVAVLGPATTPTPNPITGDLYTQATDTIPAAQLNFDMTDASTGQCKFSVAEVAKLDNQTCSTATNYGVVESSPSATQTTCYDTTNDGADVLPKFYSVKNLIYVSNYGNLDPDDISSTYNPITSNCDIIVNNHQCSDLQFVGNTDSFGYYKTFVLKDSKGSVIDLFHSTTTVPKSFGQIQSIAFFDSRGGNPVQFGINTPGTAQFKSSFDQVVPKANTNKVYSKLSSNKVILSMLDNQKGKMVLGDGPGICPTSSVCSTVQDNSPSIISEVENQKGVFTMNIEYEEGGPIGNHLSTSIVNVSTDTPCGAVNDGSFFHL